MYNFEVTNAEENYENGIWDYKEGRELTQAEVIEGGKECSQMAHMDLLADDAAAAMEQFYEQKGIEYDVIEDEPFKCRISFGRQGIYKFYDDSDGWC